MLSLTLHSLLINYQYINQLYYIIHILLSFFLCIRLFLFWICIHSWLFFEGWTSPFSMICFPSVLFFIFSPSVFWFSFWTGGVGFVASIFSWLHPNPSLSIHQACIKGLSHPERENYAYKHTSFFIHGLFFLEPHKASQLISIAVSPRNKTSSFSISAWNPKEIFYSCQSTVASIDNR